MTNVRRQKFVIETDTGGDFVDTGPAFNGMVLQMRLDVTPVGDTGVLDTGTDIKLELVNSGVVIADYDNVGGASFTRSPRIITFDTGGTEVGNQQPVSEGDSLRLTVNQSAAVAGAKTGTFYVWTGW